MLPKLAFALAIFPTLALAQASGPISRPAVNAPATPVLFSPDQSADGKQPLMKLYSHPENAIDDYTFVNGGTGRRQQRFSLNMGAPGSPGGYYSMAAVNVSGYQAFYGYSQTSSLLNANPAQTGGCCGSTTGAYLIGSNDYQGTQFQPGAWGAYIEGRNGSTQAANWTAAAELNCENTSLSGRDSTIPTPNSPFGNVSGIACFGLWLYNNGTQAPQAKYDTTAAIGVNGNPGAVGTGAQWKKGLVFAKNSVRSTNSHSEAIDLAQNYEIDWYGAADSIVSRLSSDGSVFHFSENSTIFDSSGYASANTITLNSASRQQAMIAFSDLNATKWEVGKNVNQTLVIWDQAAGKNAEVFATGASITTPYIYSAAKFYSTGYNVTVANLSSCGTSPSVAAGSTDNAGQITLGAGAPKACRMAFNTAFPNAAFCTVTPASAYAGSFYLSAQGKSGFTLTLGTGTSGAAFNYICAGN